jgi:hypothetical protein
MLNHISIGVKDVERSRRFYDAVLAPLGYTRLSTKEDPLSYGADGAQFYVSKVDRPVPPDRKSGLHICFTAPGQDAVGAFHQAAKKTVGEDKRETGHASRLWSPLLCSFCRGSRWLSAGGILGKGRLTTGIACCKRLVDYMKKLDKGTFRPLAKRSGKSLIHSIRALLLWFSAIVTAAAGKEL